MYSTRLNTWVSFQNKFLGLLRDMCTRVFDLIKHLSTIDKNNLFIIFKMKSIWIFNLVKHLSTFQMRFMLQYLKGLKGISGIRLGRVLYGIKPFGFFFSAFDHTKLRHILINIGLRKIIKQIYCLLWCSTTMQGGAPLLPLWWRCNQLV